VKKITRSNYEPHISAASIRDREKEKVARKKKELNDTSKITYVRPDEFDQ